MISILNFTKEKFSYIFNNNEKYIKWGVDNLTPEKYLELYESVVEHSSSINFILSHLIIDDIEEMDFWTLQKLALDYILFGGFALEVISKRNSDKVYKYVDMSKVRFNPDKTKVGVSNNWKTYRADVKWYDLVDDKKHTGIYVFMNPKTRGDYPKPYWVAADTNLRTMQNIIEYHYNNSENGFTPSVIINFNNGEPSKDVKEEIEKKLKEKFTGTAGQKFVISYNDTKETETTITPLQTDNLDEKFETLQKFIQNQIIVAHSITSGQLIGIKPENTGFSKTEYEEAFEIFEQSVIASLRRELEYGFSLIFNREITLKEV